MRFIKAVKIFDGRQFLPAGSVLAYDEAGTLLDIITNDEVEAGNAEQFEGILCPGFVNAHCHLELSHLRSTLAQGTGFCGFALELMDKRSRFSTARITQAMRDAEEEMLRNGIVAVGDISNTGESFMVKRDSKLYYHTFIELIALNPSLAETVLDKGAALLQELHAMGLAGSLAPHAPYSVSQELLGLIAAHNRATQQPLTIHNQESVEETRFFMGEQSQVYDLYKHLKIDISWFSPPRKSSLTHYINLLKGNRTILVHNTFSEAADVKAANRQDVHWCFCPGANLYIEGRLPDFALFTERAEQVCIGTDSLASNSRLDVLAELNILGGAQPALTESQLLAMVCHNGARALGIEERYGCLHKGLNAGLNLLKKNGTGFELVQKVF